MNKLIPGSSGGFSTALRLWLVFLFAFVFLRYSVPFSILAGAVGGFAGGWVYGWWKTKDEPQEVEPEEEEETEDTPVRLRGLKLAKQRRDARAKRRSQSRLPLSRLLKR
ncbi:MULTISPECIES: hypothetical protein [unclassified Coleofasciculus]|uniref:hypothetical protein n=1 Tax=unclassified Coleofasciculus TaxID=2692782 RepID=UPI00187DEBEB|nr:MULTISPECIES: hypothetical protein [unclassified Coleofasciculus]MBE9126191.1 hypothetical protein [Coleofasciculus sp. LEGE 07081]MBE9149602.1 hypothetical protein [Coleofasciculus sp. LEGE 07092]